MKTTTMNEEKAKFILSAYRPRHDDREDPEFAEALDLANSRPELKAWLEDQVAFDGAMVEALGRIPVPGDLRERILAGGRISAVRPGAGWKRWIASAGLQAVAALVAIGVFLAIAIIPEGGKADDWQSATIATLADLHSKKASLDLKTRDTEAIRAWLANLEPGLLEASPVLSAAGEAVGCKRIECEDGSVTIVCFEHDGKMFHLASFRLPEGEGGDFPDDPSVARIGKWLSASWGRGAYAHMLVTGEAGVDPDAMRRVIAEFNA